MDKSALDFQEHIQPELKPEVTTEVTFEELKTQVLEPKCLSCHAKWNDEGTFQEKYIKVGRPEESKLYDSVTKARMPKGAKLPDGTREPVVPLSKEELKLIYNYISTAKAVAPQGGVGTAPVSFERLQKEVLAPKCISCHQTWIQEVFFQAKHIKIGKPEESQLYESVRLARMPKGKKLPDGTRAAVVPLSTAELELIHNYITHAKPIIAVPEEIVTFKILKEKVLETKCMVCHKKWTDEASFIEKYVVPNNLEKSKLYDSVIKGRMPKAPKNEDGTPGTFVPLPDADIEMIRNYIKNVKPQ